MLNRRFLPYIVGVYIVALLFLAYVGYIAYINNVEYKKAIIENEGPYRHTPHSELPVSNPNLIGEAGRVESGHGDEYYLTPSGEYVYEIDGIIYHSKMPMSQEAIEIHKWLQTGKMSPVVEEQLRLREQGSSNVVQRVVTPDGQLHQVIVPRDHQYEEGDAILQSELAPAIIEGTDGNRTPLQTTKLTVDGVDYYPPKEYYSIEDPYKSEEYFNKFTWSVENSVSMAEVEKKVAKGELDFSLSEEAKRHVDQQLTMMERSKTLAPEIPPLSDKSPVKIRYLPDEGEDALPGWMLKLKGTVPSGSGEAAADGDYSVTDTFSEGSINEDASGASVRSDVPVSPSDLPDMVKTMPSPESMVDIEKNMTPAGIEAELSEGLSAASFDKAQQLIDQYGTEEGLRRLRESDPEAARQFESVPRPGRERHNPPTRDTSDDAASTQ